VADDEPEVKGTGTTWGPYPGDATVPPPTPQAPEIPMSSSWPVVAGFAVALRYLIPAMFAVIVAVIILGLLVHWF
jgi:hypothetical protein